MSTAHHHAEWLSLVEASGPFVSLPVLLQAFPQGLEAHDPDAMRRLKLAHEEWDDNQQGTRHDPAIHRAWVEFVLTETLELPEEVLLSGQSIPAGLQVTIAEQGETLRPDWVVVNPDEGHKRRLLVQIYPASQSLEKSVKGSRWAASPATRMMELLHACDVRLGLITNGDHWMLVNAPKGETTGYISWYATLWQEENVTLRAFRSLLGVERFFNVPDEETLDALLAQSVNSQQEVTDQLGYQVRRAVEVLVQSIDRIDQDRNRDLLRGTTETRLYEAALTVMMRLVFLFFAEENQLIPPQETEFYDTFYAVTTLREQLREQADQNGEEILERKHDAWCRLLATFRAVHGGVHHDALYIPAYGGSLFNPDRFPFLEGRKADTHWLEVAADPIPVNNRTVLHLLEALQVLQVRVPGGGVESRKLSFRALDIEQIGHVYEGLLDHTAVRATEPILGLEGSKNKEPEVSLTALEQQWQKGEAALVEFLAKQTGRSPAALKKRIPAPHPSASPGGEGEGSVGTQGNKLLIACNNDQALCHRVLPWVGLIRLDTFDYPTVIPAGSVFVTQGSDRRETGTHYTPKTLTEEIVKYTLEPLVYEGVAEGKPKEDWRLKSATELLALKVCDMAMGSGAFLVQVCRYLSERLVEAWEMEEPSCGIAVPAVQTPGASQRPILRILPDGSLSMAEPGEAILPNDPDERLAVARRIMADRCLYGVDKNPMAVEMAKLSLWLITLQKNRPFTFLDHALRCGDSLLGVTRREQIEFLHLNPDNEAVQLRTVSEIWRPLLAQAIAKRQELESFTVNDIQDLARKEALQAEAEALTSNIKIAADYLIGEALAQAGKTGNLKGEDLGVLSGLVTDALEEPDEQQRENKLRQIREKAQRMLNSGKPEGQPTREPFHWALEFPEVFLEEGAPTGFSAIVGNPPFQGGGKISDTLGTNYRDLLVHFIARQKGSADLCAYFFLRANQTTQVHGNLGLLATSTIAEGDTRSVGLEQLSNSSLTIYRAIANRQWYGNATVRISAIWLSKKQWLNKFYLDEKPVHGITTFLTLPGKVAGEPFKLSVNRARVFKGHNVYGMGFFLSSEEAQNLVNKNKRNNEVILPYLNGEELNSSSSQPASRYVINFRNWTYEEASQYGEVLKIVEERVKPQRANNKRRARREKWWLYGDYAIGLEKAIQDMDRVLAIAIISGSGAFTFVPNNQVFAHKLAVFPIDDFASFSVLQSGFHYCWAWKYSSTNLSLLNYSPSDCFETFPFPENTDTLETIGETYYTHRQTIMKTRQEGLTKTYNHFHDPTCTDPDIQTLRHLHIQMDTAVAAAYGWHDIPLNHDFHDTKQGLRFTISEEARREVLDRLLALNHHRYAEEVAQGLHDKKKGKGKGKKQAPKKSQTNESSIQGNLF
ncbi:MULTISPECIES: Eco57I restriction-modification methylase domain-containing protein [Cyanophyceae]|uniref:site-specific DNA-methyltransferase (adenine-specific) n=1 Tax=Leptolyngbya subtilissima DQ-A4 TaxID=2933933 RepID=A0ABV0K087_9CYAN|nr:type IIL restriction-modification enzyme MmeI [Nodosilinea sp. FACHB-141]MBD2112543.1 restriction endonuclease [Nodosilinea sp. FACHB-141]